MWKEVFDNSDLQSFLKMIYCFHDSCIKEMKYISGAYVGKDKGMKPLNDINKLSVIIQSQMCEHTTVEMEFKGLKFLKLFPIDANYTCEILDSTMIWKDGFIYWSDSEISNENDLESFDGTIICASRFRWRPITDAIEDKEFYKPLVK